MKRPAVSLAGLTLLGLALRLWGLGEASLWHDEVLELERATAPIRQLLLGRAIDQDPPLAALLWRFWIELGGGSDSLVATSQWWLRLPGVLCGVIAVALGGAWASRRFGPRIGRTFALLIAIAPIQVHYAQELNQYAFIPLGSIAVLIAWERVREEIGSPSIRAPGRHRALPWLWLGLLSAIALTLHYGMAFLVAATTLDLLWGSVRDWRTRRARHAKKSTSDPGRPAGLLIHLLLLGLTLTLLLSLGLLDRASTPHLDARLFGTHPIKELDYLADRLWRDWLVFGSLPFAGGPATWVAGSLAILAAWGAYLLVGRSPEVLARDVDVPAPISGRGAPSGRHLLLVGLLGSLLLVYPADILGLYPMGHRWLLFTSPLYLLCLAVGLTPLRGTEPCHEDGHGAPSRGLRGWTLGALVLLNLLLFLPQQAPWNPWLSVPREEMEPALAHLSESLEDRDLVWVSDGGWPAFRYYRARHARLDAINPASEMEADSSPLALALRGPHPTQLDPDAEALRIAQHLTPSSDLWLLLARPLATELDLAASLAERGLETRETTTYLGIQLLRLGCKPTEMPCLDVTRLDAEGSSGNKIPNSDAAASTVSARCSSAIAMLFPPLSEPTRRCSNALGWASFCRMSPELASMPDRITVSPCVIHDGKQQGVALRMAPGSSCCSSRSPFLLSRSGLRPCWTAPRNTAALCPTSPHFLARASATSNASRDGS